MIIKEKFIATYKYFDYCLSVRYTKLYSPMHNKIYLNCYDCGAILIGHSVRGCTFCTRFLRVNGTFFFCFFINGNKNCFVRQDVNKFRMIMYGFFFSFLRF